MVGCHQNVLSQLFVTDSKQASNVVKLLSGHKNCDMTQLCHHRTLASTRYTVNKWVSRGLFVGVFLPLGMN